MEAFKKELAALYPEGTKDAKHYVHIVRDRAFERLQGYLKDGTVIAGGHSDPATRWFEPTLLDGVSPRITWTLYAADGTVISYEHFDPPLLLAIDKVFAKIRNERYRFLANGESLFPVELSSFLAFSHERSVFVTPTCVDLKFRYMPYGMFRLVRLLLAGRVRNS